ncbi:MAG TPA: archaellin/type IV pilin N-terminal domain-containing protein [Thermoplasmata archaeon]|nr:archaellin/type IV pilin N-terminal domain-containing protein [Thermoplasmata archaeon]
MRRFHRRRRAVSPIIATILLVGITIIAGISLWTLRFRFPTSNPQISFYVSGSGVMETFGDGSDCKTVGSGPSATQTCEVLPAIDVVVTSFSPSTLPVAKLQLYFHCEGTIYLTGTLASMEWVPGSTGTVGGPGNGVPGLGTCGSYTPPQAGFNRFMYYQQVTPGDANLEAGDQFVISAQSFSPPYCAFAPSTSNICWVTSAQNSLIQANSKLFPSTCPSPGYVMGGNPAMNGSYGLNQCDDDYHGVPSSSCYTVSGNCEMDIIAVGPPPALALSLPFVNLYSPAG